MMKFDNLVCIYTCEQHRDYLRAFYRSAPGRFLRNLPSTAVLEVYADPAIQSSFHDDRRIVLRTAETYDNLSLKTFEMVRYCVENFGFRRLIKIDVTIMRRRIEGSQFRGRKPFDLEKIEEFLATSPIEKEYDGFVLHTRTGREQAVAWAAKKGGKIDFERIFGAGPMPPFYGGLCYCVGRAFAEFIAEHGASVAREQASYLMGAEDVMIGRLFKSYWESADRAQADEELGDSGKQQTAASDVGLQAQAPYALFDAEWYIAQNPDVPEAATDPLEHYVRLGAAQGRNPHPLFDTKWYLERYPDVGLNGANPIEHYMLFGASEGRDPHPLFDTDWYLDRYPDVRLAGANPLVHYVRFGAAEGRDPNPLFDTGWYLDRHPDALKGSVTPLEYYLQIGVPRGDSPHPLFDVDWYLQQNPDVRELAANPIEHYLYFGAAEGRDPHPLFDTDWYLAHYPDVGDRRLNPLEHYMRFGTAEGRNPHPLFWTAWYLRTYSKHRLHHCNALVDYVYEGAREGRDPNPVFSLAKYKYDDGGQWFGVLYRLVSPADVANFVGSVVGRTRLNEDWGALFRAYVEGDRKTALQLIELILRTATRPNSLYSPARATLYRIKAECLLAENRLEEALESAKESVMLEPEDGSSLDVLRACLLARDLLPAPKPNLIVLLITCEKYQERALSTYRTLVGMGLFVKVIVGAEASIHVDFDFVRVASGDFYEDLPMKIRDAINWAYETYGAAVNVLKIDDDIEIADGAAFAHFLSNVTRGRAHYVGQASGSPAAENGPVAVWRDFHYGKCKDPRHDKPYGKRTGSRYAVGLIYYLSGSAIEKFHEFVHRYPEEIASELYEDLFVGKVMEASGINLKDVRCSEMGLALTSMVW